MSKKDITIWGRDFQLPVTYMCHEDEEITPLQKEAVECFLEKAPKILCEPHDIKEYCIKHNAKDINETEIRNVFRYVIPVEILALRKEKKRAIAVMCNYKFDMEHGIAVVFENEKFLKIVTQDKII